MVHVGKIALTQEVLLQGVLELKRRKKHERKRLVDISELFEINQAVRVPGSSNHIVIVGMGLQFSVVRTCKMKKKGTKCQCDFCISSKSA